MPVSPSCVSGISARRFRNCRSFDKLWIFQVWMATFKYQMGRKIRNPRTPSTMQACLFFSNPFLEFCFSSTILLHKFVQDSASIDFLKIPIYCFGTLDTLKKVICMILCNVFFCCAIFIWIWTYKTHDLTDHQLIIGRFVLAIASMGRTKQTPRWPWFIKQLSLHSAP